MWDNRKKCDSGKDCLISVDGTDFKIKEPTPFSPMWCSHKFKGAGLHYEVGVCILTGEIVLAYCTSDIPTVGCVDMYYSKNRAVQ